MVGRAVGPVGGPLDEGTLGGIIGTVQRELFDAAPDKFFGQFGATMTHGERPHREAAVAHGVPVVGDRDEDGVRVGEAGLETEMDERIFQLDAFGGGERLVQPVQTKREGAAHLGRIEKMRRIPVHEPRGGLKIEDGAARMAFVPVDLEGQAAIDDAAKHVA